MELDSTRLETYASLYVIRGEPHRSGTCVNLSAKELFVGRMTNDDIPDLAFSNAFISRKHFMIKRENEQAVLYDLGSRHGTEINGFRIEPYTPHILRSFDIIKLAKGMVVIHFSYLFADQTLEFEPISYPRQAGLQESGFSINWEKHECYVDGQRIVMSEKEYGFIKVLNDHANQLVSFDMIKKTVWQERSTGEDGVPDVSMDELNALIYRIRKKYGKDTFTISAVRGSGYVLEKE
ncbi:FHA domain-containing protein [Paenibacillus radicis (ex Xue et al. 2023)]|uniref:FHA domain-containing protein n=1 Tax=Paenibacillus radicis (ex Xue et al. 2023) TaxID=2972489 RepID=A0ABT1YNX8_9BACL|nr:FHA domain-containing protein [Paenibacillus radicis (ex Xue et al. 2023)]MCR8633988.1 FHA domain-containing protein [Paenibacillus radicis (ex Xue et al. 2023)]